MIGLTISHYRVMEKLGEGGMGVVYKAKDTKLNRFVALKFLKRSLLEDEDVKLRFNCEAQAAAVLDHPNICTVFEIDYVDGLLFISMAFLDGRDLGRKLAETLLPMEEILEIAIQTATGLHEAHRNGVFHCDIKPSNIMLTSRGPVITDFGCADFFERAKRARRNSTAGTISYMSPEQTMGTALDHRTDIWSLGVLLYEMVTGQLPFCGPYEQTIVYSILNETPRPISELRSGVPSDLERIVTKALAKEPEDRFPSVDAIFTELRVLQCSPCLKSQRQLHKGHGTVSHPNGRLVFENDRSLLQS